MKEGTKVNIILYTILIIALCLSLYTNYEQSDRLEHARNAIDNYESAVITSIEANTAWEQAYTTCNDELRTYKYYYNSCIEKLDNTKT